MNNQLNNYIGAARRDQLIEHMEETLQHRKSFLLGHYKDMKKNNDTSNTSILADYEDYYNNINSNKKKQMEQLRLLLESNDQLAIELKEQKNKEVLKQLNLEQREILKEIEKIEKEMK
jgi:hypothetical protein